MRSAARSVYASRLWVGFGCAALGLIGVGLVSHFALLTVSLDAVRAALVLTPGALAGLWLVPLLRLGDVPLRWHLLIGVTLGVGLLSLLVLLLGWAGCLTRTNWLLWLGALFVIGLLRLPGLPFSAGAGGARRFPWLLSVPFLSLALLAAANAPGAIWAEEGFGYDVLTYHLEMPREYHEAGAIAYAPHNVYANFPSNVEMLYLLAMVVLNENVGAGTTANMIHLFLGVLSVFAVWVVARDWSAHSGLVAALMLATAGWIVYLSGLAYVENGMLLFGTVAVGAVLRAASIRGAEARTDAEKGVIGWMVLAGSSAGLACGCKYPAVAFIAAPVAIVTLMVPGAVVGKARSVFVFLLACFMTFSPWLVKNMVLTGNPVFPLANDVFRAAPPGWTPESTACWDQAHRPSPSERSLTSRASAFLRMVPGDHYQRFGPAMFFVALGGLALRRRTRVDWMLVTLCGIQVAVWLLATHLYARFAVPLLIGLVLLAGRAVGLEAGSVRQRVVAVLVVVGAGWNFAFAADLCREEAAHAVPAYWFYQGMLPAYEHYGVVNHDLGEEAKIMVVGDARAFYYQRHVDYRVVFNNNPFVETVRHAPTPEAVVHWLQDLNYSHVLVHWTEVRRLQATYGLSPLITPQLFESLRTFGLRRMQVMRRPGTNEPYAELFAVPERGRPSYGPTDKASG